MKLYREQKKAKHREKKLKKYHESKDFYNTQKRETRRLLITENNQVSAEAMRKRIHRQKERDNKQKLEKQREEKNRKKGTIDTN